MANRPLTNKQVAFCREYVQDRNGTQACIRAGYSRKTSNEQAARMLAKVSIKDYISRLEAENRVEVGITVEKVQAMYQEAFDLARTTKTTAAMVSAVTGIARLFGMDKDNSLVTDEHIKLDKQQEAEAQRIAQIRLSTG